MGIFLWTDLSPWTAMEMALEPAVTRSTSGTITPSGPRAMTLEEFSSVKYST
jgi:hypothetical protein